MAGLADRVTAAPVAFDPNLARETVAALDPSLRDGPLGALLAGAAGSAPFLAQSMQRHRDWLAEAAAQAPEDAMAALLESLRAEVPAAEGQAEAARALRRGRARAALLIALADLGGAWDLGQVTGALSDLADTAVSAAVRWLIAEELRRGKMPGLDAARAERGAAYTVLAMGKLGARELNYSSDIDLICLFDQDQFGTEDYPEAKQRFIRMTRALVKLLSDQTEDGYVFRTDLRLRPAPSTTPVCIAMEAAERYYESLGRTWERAAHIKARPIAGDIAAGEAYLERLRPFVWRRYLDFAAIEDTHEMLRKIRAKKGKFTPEGLPGHDLKLGPGGIREIEFFAQTRQLIGGGREPRLRVPATLDALEALVEVGQVPRRTADTLSADYVAHRTLEHRLQMVADAQTQTIPPSEEARARVAALAGWSDRAAWERDLAERLGRVHRTCEAFFAAEPESPRPDPEADLASLGFDRPDDARRLLDRWRSGALPATRTARARGLFAEIEPDLLACLGRAAHPDEAIAEFDRFLSGLPAGVQVFSLFRANPHLMELIAEICAAAPRLAVHLGRAPGTLDALLAQDFFAPLPGAGALAQDLARWIGEEADYERVLDIARRWAREQRFRVGVQVLRGMAEPEEAGAAHSAIAEACVTTLLPHVVADFSTRHGPPPGEGMAVIALGKLGTREMTGGSDLDLITVYDPGEASESEGRRPLTVGQYYPRLTQALVAALTAPTAEGRLYEVDMRLRPSGRQGPVSVSLSAFRSYQAEKAWVWEHMAMTRARAIAGPRGLREAVATTIREAVAGRAGRPEVLSEAREMRARLIDAHAGARANPWALKHTAGGLMEIEFLAQTGALALGLAPPCGAAKALPRLPETGWLGAEEAAELEAALALLQALQQVERVATEKPFAPDEAGPGLRAAMARAAGVEEFDALERLLRDRLSRSAAIVESVFGDETPAPGPE